MSDEHEQRYGEGRLAGLPVTFRRSAHGSHSLRTWSETETFIQIAAGASAHSVESSLQSGLGAAVHEEPVAALLHHVGRKVLLAKQRSLHEVRSHVKSDGTYVSNIDLAAQRALIDGLSAIRRPDAIVAEEYGKGLVPITDPAVTRGGVWLVDPLDGTVPFLAGGDRFGIVVAWLSHGRVHDAWIYMPARDCLMRTTTYGVSVSGLRTHPTGAVAKFGMCGWHGDPLETTTVLCAVQDAEIKVEIDPPAASADYADLLAAQTGLAIYLDPKPWDHLAGIHILRRRGYEARCLRHEPTGAPLLGLSNRIDWLDHVQESYDAVPAMNPGWLADACA